MTPLERRYRRLLRLLPADYRAKWEEDMVDTFLLARAPARPAAGGDAGADAVFDAAFDAEYGQIGSAEVASVAGLAVRLRLGGVDAPPRSFARGEIVRRVALAGLLVHAVAAVTGVVALLVTRIRFPGHRVSDWETVGSLSAVVWVGAYLALLADRRRMARWLGTVALVPSVVIAAVTLPAGGTSPVTTAYQVLVTALPVFALAAFHRDAPAVRARPWLVALPVGVAVVTVVALLTQTPQAIAVDWSGLLCGALVVACVVHLVAARPGPWSGALAVLAVAVLGERVCTLIDYARFTAPGPQLDLLLTAGVVEAGALALATAVVLIRARPAASGSPPRVLGVH